MDWIVVSLLAILAVANVVTYFVGYDAGWKSARKEWVE